MKLELMIKSGLYSVRFFLFFFLIVPFIEAKYDCRAFLELEVARAELHPEKQFVFLDSYSGAYINGRIDESGALTFSIRTRDSSGNFLNPDIRANQLFEKMMIHFGSKVTRVVGEWSVHQKEAWEGDYSSSTNLKQFNEYLMSHQKNRGYPTAEELKEAAKNTWTARQSAKYGFTEVHLLLGSQHDNQGNHSYMSVEFYRIENP